MKYALITGITGQDGSYLSELLLEKGYKVHGIIRRSSNFNTHNIEHIFDKLHLHYGDVNDLSSIICILKRIYDGANCIEFYNLAAQSHVKVSFENPIYTATTNSIGTLNCLEAVRIVDERKIVKFYQASTSEMYGKVQQVPQSETTPFYPRSPYGVSKIYSYWIVKNYRESYNMFACNGILFNHESPRRGKTFVTRKITHSLSRIIKGEQDVLYLGNIYAKRDWGHAKDYVYGMWLMLQEKTPDDYVLSTNETHTVKEFIEECMKNISSTNIIWEGEGVDEIGYWNNKPIIKINKKYFRPSEVDILIGDNTKSKQKLGWKPTYTFQDLVKEMIENDNVS